MSPTKPMMPVPMPPAERVVHIRIPDAMHDAIWAAAMADGVRQWGMMLRRLVAEALEARGLECQPVWMRRARKKAAEGECEDRKPVIG